MADFEAEMNGVKVEIEKNRSLLIGAGVLGIGLIIMTRYKTSKASEWLVRTGLGVQDIEIGKKFFKWPLQNIDTINMSPSSYKFSVKAMSIEKMEFTFPAVFTIGTRNEEESLVKFSRFLLSQPDAQTDDMIRGIIEGETRSLSANLSIEDIFTGRSAFKKDILDSVQKQLNQYGLEIYNANIEELKDGKDSNYFMSLSKRINAEAGNRAKVDVAEQNKLGDVGSKIREGETRQRVASVEAETTLVENSMQQDILKSNAELEKLRAEQSLIIKKANICAENFAMITRMEMETEVEAKKCAMQVEKQRAAELSQTVVKAEMDAKKAEGESNSQRILADAQLYSSQKQAEGNLYTKQKEAEGMGAMLLAQAQGLDRLVASFGGSTQALITYTMLEKGLYEKLAESNAKAIQGLNPKISVWTHDPNHAYDPIKSLGKSLIPLVDTIHDQTGYKLPDWILQKTPTQKKDQDNENN